MSLVSTLLPHSPLLRRLTLVATTIALAACDTPVVFDHYEHTPLAGWEKNDTLFYDIPPLRQSGRYREEIGLRTNEDFPFQRLCLVIEQTAYPSAMHRIDTVFYSLVSKQGIPEGDGVSLYQKTFPLRTIKLNEGDSLHISIRHNMKREILPGISDVGLKISLAP